jgi:ribonuclease HI
MNFKGQPVWVRVGDDQRPVLDSDGRAEMKYRQEDPKSYRPSPGNLVPPAEQGSPPASPAQPRPPRAPRATSASSPKPRARSASTTDDHAPDTIHVWTDGACSGNPGPMGIGIVVVADRERAERGEYLGVGTNNIAELTAISRGLDLAAELAPDRTRPIRVYSDSNYAGQGLESQGQPRTGGQPARTTGDFLASEAGQGGWPRRRGQQRALRPARPPGGHVTT